MKISYLSLTALLFVTTSCAAAPVNTDVATSPGTPATATAPIGTDFDLQGFIDGAVKAGQKTIVIPPGRYRVTPKNRQHLRLEGLKDIEIVAENVELICTQTTRAISIHNCSNLTLRGLTIDYDPLPFTQGRITAVSADKTVVNIELFDGYPRAKTAVKTKYEVFVPDTRTLRYDSPTPKGVEAIEDNQIRVTKPNGEGEEQVGDLIVIGSQNAPDGQIPHAIYTSNSSKIKLQDINLWSSNSFGFFESECDGTTYQRCRIDRRGAESDLVPRADARLRSLNADAFHSNSAAQGPRILDCTAKWMGDDAVNIRGQYSLITATTDGKYRVLVNGTALAAGDPVELWNYAGVRLPDAKVVTVESDGKINATEREWLGKQRMDARLRTTWEPDAIRITLDRAADLPLGALISSTKRMGNDFLVQGNDFGFNRSRGILIKGSNGAVRNNKLTQNLGAAILVTPEYWWLESGSAKDVLIADNTIRDCSSFAIKVGALAGQGGVAPSGAHSDITISGNVITGSPLPNIVATSTDDLRITGNVLAPAPTLKIADWALAQTGLDKNKLQPVMTVNSNDPVIEKNTVK